MPLSDHSVHFDNFFFKQNNSLSQFDVKVLLHFQSFEIYNDLIYDLLGKNKQVLKLRQKNKKYFVHNLKTLLVSNTTDIPSLLEQVVRNRKVNSTNLNSNSSRSHAVFNLIYDFLIVSKGGSGNVNNLHPLKIESFKVDQDRNCFQFQKIITVVDLAGSERFKRTKNNLQGIKEANSVNTSLSCLGRCLEALKSRARVPYRETKLTQYLSKFFYSGNSISMIANINPCEEDFPETVRVLHYANTTTYIQPIKSKLRKFRLSKKALSLRASPRRVSSYSPVGLGKPAISDTRKRVTSHSLCVQRLEHQAGNLSALVHAKFSQLQNMLYQNQAEAVQKEATYKKHLRILTHRIEQQDHKIRELTKPPGRQTIQPLSSFVFGHKRSRKSPPHRNLRMDSLNKQINRIEHQIISHTTQSHSLARIEHRLLNLQQQWNQHIQQNNMQKHQFKKQHPGLSIVHKEQVKIQHLISQPRLSNCLTNSGQFLLENPMLDPQFSNFTANADLDMHQSFSRNVHFFLIVRAASWETDSRKPSSISNQEIFKFDKHHSRYIEISP